MPRQRQVYPTHEIAGLWWSERQESARNPQGNFYFRNRIIYSYRDGFPIARKVDSSLVLINRNRYSMTTGRHINLVRYAITPSRVTTIYVNYPGLQLSLDTLRELEDDFIYAVNRAKRARRYGDVYLADARRYANHYAIVAEYLGLEQRLPIADDVKSTLLALRLRGLNINGN